MPITLQTMDASGETQYISKHNNNYAQIESAINALQNFVGATSDNIVTRQNAYAALFGDAGSTIGEGSLAHVANGSTLEVAPGYVFDITDGTVRHVPIQADINFTGFTAGTYYSHVDSAGGVSVDTDPANAIYQIDWNGSSFTAITPILETSFGHTSYLAALDSTVMGEIYTSLDQRMEAAESSASSFHPVDVDGSSANVTLTNAEGTEHAGVLITGAETGDLDLIVPDVIKPYSIINQSTGGFAITVKTAAGTGITLGNGDTAHVVVDGTNVLLLAISKGGAAPQKEIHFQFFGVPGADERIGMAVMGLSSTIPAGMTGARFKARVAATAAYDIDVQKNGVSVGTISWAAAATDATFTMASATSLASDDDLDLVGQATPDATLEDIRGVILVDTA